MRPGSTATSRRSIRRTAERRACLRAASSTLDEATAAAERTILGLRMDRGLPLSDADEPPLAESFGWALATRSSSRSPATDGWS